MDKKFEITGNSHDCFDNQIFAEFVTTKQRYSEIDAMLMLAKMGSSSEGRLLRHRRGM